MKVMVPLAVRVLLGSRGFQRAWRAAASHAARRLALPPEAVAEVTRPDELTVTLTVLTVLLRRLTLGAGQPSNFHPSELPAMPVEVP